MLSKQKLASLLTVLVLCTSSIYAEGPAVFSMPDSIVVFATYDEVRVVTPNGAETIKPPAEVGANHGYFAYPSISPRGDLIAWGFATGVQEKRARFTLGVYSLAERKWKTYGDFDNIGATVFLSDGSKIAFVAMQQNKRTLMIFDVAKETMTNAPYPKGMPEAASLSWSPDAKRLAVEIQRGEKNSLVAVLDLDTGNVQTLGEGFNPAWSPNGEWIAYFDPAGAKCIVVHPDGTGAKVVKKVSQLLVSFRRFGWGGPVWSPDSRQMLLSEMKGDGDYIDVVLVDVGSGRETKKARNGLPVFGWANRTLAAKR
jgi:Tol biopolymer transport system component